MKKTTFLGLCLILFSGGAAFILQAENLNRDVQITQIKGKDYYHLQLELTKINYKVNKKYGFNEGGLFEVFLNKEFFPVSAPKCKKHIVIRMPWTDVEIKNANQYIREKEELYNKLLNIGDNSQLVALELNPYVKFNNGKIELTRCNAFFRHAKGRYVNSLE